MNLMDSFRSTRKLSDYASEKYSRSTFTADLWSMRRPRSRCDSRSDAAKVRDMLEAHGAIQKGLDGEAVIHVFFVPKLMASSIKRFSDVILADVKHQLNCRGYDFWHAMLVEDAGLGRRFFDVILSTENVLSISSS